MHSVPLTSEERQVVLDYTSRLEKLTRRWRVFRWLAVGCFILGLGLLLAADQVNAKMRATMELPAGDLKLPDGAGLKAIESSLQLLAAHGDARVTALRVEMYLLLKVLIVAGIGTGMFVYVVSQWKRDQRDRLVVTLLRSAVDDTGSVKDES